MDLATIDLACLYLVNIAPMGLVDWSEVDLLVVMIPTVSFVDLVGLP